MARTITALIFGGVCVVTLLRVWQTHTGTSERLLALLACGVLLVTQIVYFGGHGHNPRSWTGVAVLGVQLVAAYGALPLLGNSWLSMQVIAIANLPLVLPAWLGWTSWAVVIAGMGALAHHYGEPPLGVAYLILVSAYTSVVILGLTLLRQLVHTLVNARATIAEALLSLERLRFARDVHDLLGSRLSVIVVRCELIRRLQSLDPGRVTHELRSLLDLCRSTLEESTGVADGTHGGTLAEALEAAHEALATGSTTLRTDVSPPRRPLTAPEERALAAVVREGTVNVLRHSDAATCCVTVREVGDEVELTIENDAARPAVSPPGSGLSNLSQRMAIVGGSFVAERLPGDRFRVRALLPVTPARPTVEGPRHEPADPRHLAATPVTDEPAPFTDGLASRRLTGPLLGVTLAGTVGVEFLWSFAVIEGPLWRWVSVLTTVVVSAVVLFYVDGPAVRLRTRCTMLLVSTVLILGPQLALSNPHIGSTGTLLAVALLTWGRSWWGVATAAAIVITTVVSFATPDPLEQVYLLVSTALPGLAIYGVAQAITVARRARADQWERARLALTRERLRFEVDLNGRLEQVLTGILERGHTALLLQDDDSLGAAAAVEAMIGDARAGLEDIRLMGTGYRARAQTADGVTP